MLYDRYFNALSNLWHLDNVGSIKIQFKIKYHSLIFDRNSPFFLMYLRCIRKKNSVRHKSLLECGGKVTKTRKTEFNRERDREFMWISFSISFHELSTKSNKESENEFSCFVSNIVTCSDKKEIKLQLIGKKFVKMKIWSFWNENLWWKVIYFNDIFWYFV
jgi:hypothetical protein